MLHAGVLSHILTDDTILRPTNYPQRPTLTAGTELAERQPRSLGDSNHIFIGINITIFNNIAIPNMFTKMPRSFYMERLFHVFDSRYNRKSIRGIYIDISRYQIMHT